MFYKNSFFADGKLAISTARAGNVICGGDFANDRIIPDCVRALENNADIIVRNPNSTRPYQHVLEPVFAYLMIAKAQYEDASCADCYNVGPDDCDCVTTGELVDLFVSEANAVHEANFLKLDCSKIKSAFGWKPHWRVSTAIEKTVEWSKVWLSNGNIRECMDKQIEDYIKRDA